MKLIWLGQAGYQLVTRKGTNIYIDPYLSDSLLKEKGESYSRQVPIRADALRAYVDILVLTHAHADHMDLASIDSLVENNDTMCILAPRNVLGILRPRYSHKSLNYMLFDPGVEITLVGIRFTACYACHSDEKPIGVVIEADGKVICHTGDTMYHRQLLTELPKGVDALLIPINGFGNNMNATDAARLVRFLEPQSVYPMHWDMFKQYGCDVKEFVNLFDEKERQIIKIPAHYDEVIL